MTESRTYTSFGEAQTYEAQVSGSPVYGVTYTRDALGRITAKTETIAEGTTTTGYRYDVVSRLDQVTTDGVVTARYTYTPNGELRTKSDAAGTTTYTYDLLGNLMAVQLPDGRLIEYVIDGPSRRIGKRVNGVLVQGWLYRDQLKPVAELDGTGQVVARFAVQHTGSGAPASVQKGPRLFRLADRRRGRSAAGSARAPAGAGVGARDAPPPPSSAPSR